MKRLRPLVRHVAAVLLDRRAATAVEYGLIIAMVVLGMLVALSGVAGLNAGIWGNVNNAVQGAS